MYQISFKKQLPDGPKTEWIIEDDKSGEIFSITLMGHNNIAGQGRIESMLFALDYGEKELGEYVK